MSKPLKPKRGTTSQNNAYIGEAHEVTLDTDKHTLVVCDGLTAGGFPLARADEVATKNAQQDAAIATKLSTSGGTVTGQVRFAGVPSSGDIDGQVVFPGIYRGVVTKLLPGNEYADWHVQDANGNPIGNFRFTNDDAKINLGIQLQATGEGVSWPGGIDLSFDKATKKFSAKMVGNDIITAAGGVMNDTICFNTSDAICGLQDWIYVRAGKTNQDGASLYLSSKNDSDRGAFKIRAHDGSTEAMLLGRSTDKVLKWCGNEVPTLVASWNDDNGNWYRKYSDGWIEQGGRGASGEYISFSMAFSNTNYTMTALTITPFNGASTMGVYDQTTTGFYITTSYNNYSFYWYACGY